MPLFPWMKKKSNKKSFWSFFLRAFPQIERVLQSKELMLICFFCWLFLILIIRLFWLQIIKHVEYNTQLSKLHY